MQYIKPHDNDDPTLGPDGCIYELVDGEWKKIYESALQNNFRFLSYGDGCLIFFPALPLPPSSKVE